MGNGTNQFICLIQICSLVWLRIEFTLEQGVILWGMQYVKYTADFYHPTQNNPSVTMLNKWNNNFKCCINIEKTQKNVNKELQRKLVQIFKRKFICLLKYWNVAKYLIIIKYIIHVFTFYESSFESFYILSKSSLYLVPPTIDFFQLSL